MGEEEVSRQFLWLGYIGLSLIVFGIIFYFLVDATQGHTVYQDLYSKDISLLTSSVLTSNGNIEVEYFVLDRPKVYDLEITNLCEIKISEKEKGISHKESICLKNENTEINENKVNLDELKITFKDNMLILEEL